MNRRCIPPEWKKCVIIPLYKGHRKENYNQNSCRGIALSSCIGKLFEIIIESKLVTLKTDFPNKTQMGYRKKLSSMHASYNLQETINYNKNRNSPVYVTLLDSTKAFDTV